MFRFKEQILIMIKFFRKTVLRLRLEEAVAVVFFVPSAVVTLIAYFHFLSKGDVPRYVSGGVWRLGFVIGFFLIIHIAAKFKERSKFALLIREALPFGLAIAVYTNLHDTIAFVNPGDISPVLIKIDEALFGVNPVLWAEKLYNPILTEIFSFCYLNHFWFSLILGIVLYVSDSRKHFRSAMLGIVLLYYAGYIFYIIFPAVPPRLTLIPYFIKNFDGSVLGGAVDKVVNISFATSRAAFPSLHCANTLITLMYAYKYKRWLSFIFLPIAIGLVFSTVYLRHHYVIDIIAGFVLAIIVYLITPKISAFWEKMQSKAVGK